MKVKLIKLRNPSNGPLIVKTPDGMKSFKTVGDTVDVSDEAADFLVKKFPDMLEKAKAAPKKKPKEDKQQKEYEDKAVKSAPESKAII